MRLVHRGPDDEGFYDDNPVSLGFRRLSVIDLETGQQPIVLEDGRAAIVLNGEIYNFRELRAELEAKGHSFRSRGDVEVVLRLFAEEGIGCLARLNGMFALALWDRRERVLHLARDRFGIKPLFWCRDGGLVGFASEIRALLAGGFPVRRELDPAELRHYLALGHASPGGALLKGVRAVPPGSVLSLTADDREQLKAYWRPPETEVGRIALEDAARTAANHPGRSRRTPTRGGCPGWRLSFGWCRLVDRVGPRSALDFGAADDILGGVRRSRRRFRAAGGAGRRGAFGQRPP